MGVYRTNALYNTQAEDANAGIQRKHTDIQPYRVPVTQYSVPGT